MAESDLIRAVRDLLTIYKKQEKIVWWERLNSGKILQVLGPKRYMVQLCQTGTPDFIVASSIDNTKGACYDPHMEDPFTIIVTFLECKTEKGKLTKEQEQFRDDNTWAGFHVIRDIEEVIKLYASNN